MRLTVRDERGQFNRETHAYAEYRAFSSTIGSHVPVEEVTVTLSRRPVVGTDTEGGGVVCAISIRKASGDVVQVRAVARHAYAAIDEVVSRIREGALSTESSGRSRQVRVDREKA